MIRTKLHMTFILSMKLEKTYVLIYIIYPEYMDDNLQFLSKIFTNNFSFCLSVIFIKVNMERNTKFNVSKID